MNRAAEQHLAKAEDYLGKGEGFYRKAVEEIVAAKEADATLSNREIGERFGKKQDWVGRLVAWGTGDDDRRAPFGGDTPANRAVRVSATKRVLREAPLEQVEQIIGELPQERQQAIAAAAGDRYAKALQNRDEAERRLTPAQRKEREAAGATVDQNVADMTAGFDALSIANHLDQATGTLSEMIAHNTVTPDGMKHIDLALTAFLDEYQVAQAQAGVEVNE